MPALHSFVRLLVSGPGESGLVFCRGNRFVRELQDSAPLGRGEVAAGLSWSDIASLIAAHKEFWGAIPIGIFDDRCLDVRPLARQMTGALFGSTKSEDVAQVAVLLRRLRKYWMHGRLGASVSRRELLALLRSQRGRCKTCGHRFTPADLRAQEYEGEVDAAEQIAGLRPPHVDHIVPIYLGGTRSANLQILCTTCNAGKGAATVWPLKSAMLRPLRPSELLRPSTSLRWMTLESAQRCSMCVREPSAMQSNEELLVQRIDPAFGWVIENTQAVCTSCAQTRPFESLTADWASNKNDDERQ